MLWWDGRGGGNYYYGGMDYCFDTSAIAAKHVASLYDDPDRPALVAGLLASGRVLVTALNVIEAGGTEESARRSGILRLEKELVRNLYPLKTPTEVLQALSLAHIRGERRTTLTISEAESGIYATLCEPEQLGEQERQEVYRWKSSLEDSFAEANRLARPEFQVLFEDTPNDRPRTAAKLIKLFKNENKIVLDAPIYKRLTGSDLDLPSMQDLFLDIPEWPLYLAGWAHGMYHRAIKNQNFGVNSNPGTVDLMLAVYLRFCDCFVTSDVRQRRALRILNVLNPRRPKTQIISYGELRRRLVVKPM